MTVSNGSGAAGCSRSFWKSCLQEYTQLTEKKRRNKNTLSSLSKKESLQLQLASAEIIREALLSLIKEEQSQD